MQLLGAVAVAITLLLAAAGPPPEGTTGGNEGSGPGDCGGQAYADVLIEGTPRIWLEVAADRESILRGLMDRRSLDPDAGMLFLFPGDALIGFWMENTYIPLSVAFIAGDGTILDIQDMEPLSEETHVPRPPRPYRAAIEVNQGWFEAHGVKPGDKLRVCLGRPPVVGSS